MNENNHGRKQEPPVIHAANQCPSLQFKFPTTVAECKEVAEEFTFQSQAGFNNCVGCIDGMLVWTEKPLSSQCDKVGVDSGNFFCGQKCIVISS